MQETVRCRHAWPTHIEKGMEEIVCKKMRDDAQLYLNARPVLEMLKRSQDMFSYKQYRKLRDNALNGHLDIVYDELRKLGFVQKGLPHEIGGT